jgi:hypothetical protein
MYISKAVVDFRQDARTEREAAKKVERMQGTLGGHVVMGQDVITPTLMCELGARKRRLDMKVAAADAKYWWQTRLVPLRATPLGDGNQPDRR